MYRTLQRQIQMQDALNKYDKRTEASAVCGRDSMEGMGYVEKQSPRGSSLRETTEWEI